MKKKLTYRDQLLELSRIYNVREIQEYIKRPLSEALLFGELKKGGIVKIYVNKNKLDLSFKSLSEKPSKKISDNILS